MEAELAAKLAAIGRTRAAHADAERNITILCAHIGAFPYGLPPVTDFLEEIQSVRQQAFELAKQCDHWLVAQRQLINLGIAPKPMLQIREELAMNDINQCETDA